MDAPVTRAELDALTEKIEALHRKFDDGNSFTSLLPQANVSGTLFAQPQGDALSGAEEVVSVEESLVGHGQGMLE